MREIDTKEFKRVEFDLLAKTDEVCRAQGIKYSLCGGTLLGAIRHKGFIPWDDDIDIAMPRNDYNCFMNYVNTHGAELGMHVVSSGTDPNYAYLFGKVCDSNTIIEEENFNRDGSEMGVYVDIFPIDGLGREALALKHFKTMWFSRELLVACNWKKYFRSKTHAWYIEPVRFVIYCISRFASPKKLIHKVEKYYSQYPLDKSEYAAIVCGSYWEKEIMPASVLSNFCEVEFEGKCFMAFRDYDEYLKRIYGDYMELPPKEKQVTHHMFKAYWKD